MYQYDVKFHHILTYEEFNEAVKCIENFETTYVVFWLPDESDIALSLKMCYQAYADRLSLNYKFFKKYIYVYLPRRKAIEYYYQQKFNPPQGQNRMGCNESWYDPYYAISQTFDTDTVDKMDDKELENLIKLAEAIQGALY